RRIGHSARPEEASRPPPCRACRARPSPATSPSLRSGRARSSAVPYSVSANAPLAQFRHHGFGDLKHLVALEVATARETAFLGRVHDAKIRHDALEHALQRDAID